MDWNMLYTNGDAPSLKQIAEYIDNPLWAEFDSRIRSAYRIEPTAAVPCSQAGILNTRKAGNLFVPVTQCRVILSLLW